MLYQVFLSSGSDNKGDGIPQWILQDHLPWSSITIGGCYILIADDPLLISYGLSTE